MDNVPFSLQSLNAWFVRATLTTSLTLLCTGCSFSYKPEPDGGGGQATSERGAESGSELASKDSSKADSPQVASPQAPIASSEKPAGESPSAEGSAKEQPEPETPAADKTAPEKTDSPAEGKVAAGGAEGSREKPSEPPTTGRPMSPAKRDLLQIESTSRGRTRENGVELITFDDLNLGMQADMVFRDFLLTDRARELDGQKVRIVGYMDGGVSQQKGIKEFVLLKNTECKFGAGGQADHLLRVLLQDGVTVDYTRFGALQIEGVLKISPFNGPDGNTWSVYDLLGNSAKPIKKK
ncbi:MAG: hypothetical protein U1A77_26315 [Pirellulales bacterium]